MAQISVCVIMAMTASFWVMVAGERSENKKSICPLMVYLDLVVVSIVGDGDIFAGG